MMHFMRVKRLPVVNPGGQLVGIVTRSDLLAVFDRPDEDIRREIVDMMLLHEFLIDPRACSVSWSCGPTADGVVTNTRTTPLTSPASSGNAGDGHPRRMS